MKINGKFLAISIAATVMVVQMGNPVGACGVRSQMTIIMQKYRKLAVNNWNLH